VAGHGTQASHRICRSGVSPAFVPGYGPASVMSRGDHGEAIFRDDQDRVRLLETLEETCEKTGWRVHAYVLLANHYHLLVETPEANLVAGMQWFQGTYTQRFNSRHRLRGHLFQGRYKALAVERKGRAAEDLQAEWRAIRRGWYLGGESFRDRLLEGLGKGNRWMGPGSGNGAAWRRRRNCGGRWAFWDGRRGPCWAGRRDRRAKRCRLGG